MPAMDWYVYILRCADDTLYTGITTDVERRLAEHNAGTTSGARYTRSRGPVELLYVESAVDRSRAASREAQIKRLERGAKLQLIATNPAIARPDSMGVVR
jgi:putative endonuclease